MKVLLLSNTFGAYGGIEAFVLNLAKFLEEKNISYRICFRHLRPEATPQPSLALACQGLHKNIYHLTHLKEFTPHIRWASIVHAQQASPYLCFPVKSLNTPLYLTIHNQFFESRFDKDFLHKFSKKLANDFHYNSHFVQDSWEKDLLPNKVKHTNSELSFALAPFENRRGFISLSRIVPNKGVDLLIKAYLQAKINHQEHPLTIVGEGSLLDNCRVLAKNSPNIFFTGFVDNEEKYKLLDSAKWLVAVPEVAEDMGLTPLEARSRGIPCIVSKEGGLPEVAGEESIFVAEPSLGSIAQAYEEAVSIDRTSYEERSRKTFHSAKQLLVPYSFYLEHYKKLC